MAENNTSEVASEETDEYMISDQSVEVEAGTYESRAIFDDEGLLAGVEYIDEGTSYNPSDVEAYVRDQNGDFREISLDGFKKIRKEISGKDSSDISEFDQKLEGQETAEEYK